MDINKMNITLDNAYDQVNGIVHFLQDKYSSTVIKNLQTDPKLAWGKEAADAFPALLMRGENILYSFNHEGASAIRADWYRLRVQRWMETIDDLLLKHNHIMWTGKVWTDVPVYILRVDGETRQVSTDAQPIMQTFMDMAEIQDYKECAISVTLEWTDPVNIMYKPAGTVL
ncbi:hypothetical protein [uncultured Duncaniella sp.]|uniref:hypothetical protein n=1 Tax=uncultured Duncaniella sp. TaxID=2768039 RepID=UPI00263A205F|nr:hypothetical protein [uncultured Duncaniella sp.]